MKKLFTLGSILLAAALALCCAGCGEEASSKEETTSAASSAATADEAAAFDGTIKTDLSKLHEVDYENGNAFAGAWKITEGQGDQFQSFTFVFDGKDNAYMMIGSMGYCGKYELNEDTGNRPQRKACDNSGEVREVHLQPRRCDGRGEFQIHQDESDRAKHSGFHEKVDVHAFFVHFESP